MNAPETAVCSSSATDEKRCFCKSKNWKLPDQFSGFTTCDTCRPKKRKRKEGVVAVGNRTVLDHHQQQLLQLQQRGKELPRIVSEQIAQSNMCQIALSQMRAQNNYFQLLVQKQADQFSRLTQERGLQQDQQRSVTLDAAAQPTFLATYGESQALVQPVKVECYMDLSSAINDLAPADLSEFQASLESDPNDLTSAESLNASELNDLKSTESLNDFTSELNDLTSVKSSIGGMISADGKGGQMPFSDSAGPDSSSLSGPGLGFSVGERIHQEYAQAAETSFRHISRVVP